MKEYFKGIIRSISVIGIGMICLGLSIVVGPTKSFDFFEGFLRGAGYNPHEKNVSFIDFDKIKKR